MDVENVDDSVYLNLPKFRVSLFRRSNPPPLPNEADLTLSEGPGIASLEKLFWTLPSYPTPLSHPQTSVESEPTLPPRSQLERQFQERVSLTSKGTPGL